MGRSDWSAVRMMANSIAFGGRSYWNLMNIPDLPPPGRDAINELAKDGLVKVSLVDNRVEPTAAFWPWLEELRTAEANASAIPNTGEIAPVPRAIIAPGADRQNLQASSVIEESTSRPEVCQPLRSADGSSPARSLPHTRTRNSKRRELFSHLKPVPALAAEILMTLCKPGRFKDKITKRAVERAKNANKHADWAAAWSLLIREKCIRVTAGPNRQQFIALLEIPRYLQPQVKKPRRRRKPTQWFKDHEAEFYRRDGYDERADAIEELRWEGEAPPSRAPGDRLAG